MRSIDAGGKVGCKCGQVMCWHHELPARNERKAPEACREKTARLGRVAGRAAPRSQQVALAVPRFRQVGDRFLL